MVGLRKFLYDLTLNFVDTIRLRLAFAFNKMYQKTYVDDFVRFI